MRAAAAAAALLAGAAAAAMPAAPASHAGGHWRLELHSTQHSDATRLSQSGDLQGSQVTPRRGRNLAYLDDELRLSREQGRWTWGLIARSRATLVASEDTLALYRQADGGQPLSEDAQWQVQARLRGFSGRGLLVGSRIAATPAPTSAPTSTPPAQRGPGWQLDWELQALQLSRWRERHLSGSASASAANDTYAIALRSSEHSDRLAFPFQTAYPPHGVALLGRVALSAAGERWRVAADVQDLGWLQWRRLPRQEALLDSRVAAVDADGFVIYRPLVQGQNTQADLRRAAPARASLALAWQPSATARWEAEAGADILPGLGLMPWLGVRLPVGAATTSLRWRAHERRLAVQWQWQGLLLRAGTDRLGPGAQSRELALAWQFTL